MRRTEQLQGLRLMQFEEIYGRADQRAFSQLEAAEILGVSERIFRRWRDRLKRQGQTGFTTAALAVFRIAGCRLIQ